MFTNRDFKNIILCVHILCRWWEIIGQIVFAQFAESCILGLLTICIFSSCYNVKKATVVVWVYIEITHAIGALRGNYIPHRRTEVGIYKRKQESRKERKRPRKKKKQDSKI